MGDLTPLGSSGVTTRASHELPGVDVILPFVRSDPVLRKRSDVGELTPLRSSGHHEGVLGAFQGGSYDRVNALGSSGHPRAPRSLPLRVG